MTNAPRHASEEEVPILDLTPWLAGGSPDALVAQLKSACVGTGFFYVKGAVDRQIIDALFDASRRYFAIPETVRMADMIDERFHRGFMPYGINRHPGFDPDLKESYVFGVDLPENDPDVMQGRPLHGPNRWPACAPWLKGAADTYLAATTNVARHLLRLFALALGQQEDLFLDWSRKPMVQARLFHYPAQDGNAELALGVAPHTDFGMITILAQDPIGGLELQKRDGEWISAPYVEDTLVVNLGDMMKIWSNDHFVSNLHRVVNRSGKERYSFPTFFNLDYDAPVECLPNFQSDANPPRHAPTKSGDYLVRRVSETQRYRAPTAA